ncbi:hypothetical protein CBR_g56843 [Chara braunii]|uniref:DDE Tnp4 domain-containing protein n=1 Tax=Chara braunii TaxID=69332 RepID=A0A388MDR8_CHABU|nr:hypothetical protein CBR_g56843 [Chara braunii]|eukprot:GBG92704.1 hypothetical protein CBR_g56843 [Chara braunii]
MATLGGEELVMAEGDEEREREKQEEEYEERVRLLLTMCYDEGRCPEDIPLEEVEIEGNEAVVTVDARFDAIKVRWLKERTVVIIFRYEARNLPRKVKEDIVRAYENGWNKEGIFDPPIEKGRIKFEGPNVISYVAKNCEVAEWMINEGMGEVMLKRKRYVFETKAWMPRAEWQEFGRIELEKTFWILAIQVPLDAYVYLHSALTKVIGPVVKMDSPDRFSPNPRLLNIRCELNPECRERFVDRLWVRLTTGGMVEVRLANAATPYCNHCRWYFHTEDECTRKKSNPNRRRGRSGQKKQVVLSDEEDDRSSRSLSSQSEGSIAFTRRRGANRYKGPLSHEHSSGSVMRNRGASPPPPPHPLYERVGGGTGNSNGLTNGVGRGVVNGNDPGFTWGSSASEGQNAGCLRRLDFALMSPQWWDASLNVEVVVVDLDLRITDVFVGYPGSCHDIQVLQLSSLWSRAEEGDLFRGPAVVLLFGVKTHSYILGDNGYPPLEWIVVPYEGTNQVPDEERFDNKQKVARGAVEKAFRRLKGMWRLFLRTHKTNMDTLPQQFQAVCILHNILLDAGMEFDENLLWEVDANGMCRRVDLGLDHPPHPIAENFNRPRALALREALAERMKHA